MKLNLGCGDEKIPGYINVDNDPGVEPDKIVDLMKSLPFKNNSIEEIRCWRVMEHLPGLQPMYLLREIYRILKPGGIFIFRVPIAGLHSRIAIDHVSVFTPRSFECKPWHKYKFKSYIKVTPPLLHKLKFPAWFWYINFIIPWAFTGIEGELIKE